MLGDLAGRDVLDGDGDFVPRELDADGEQRSHRDQHVHETHRDGDDHHRGALHDGDSSGRDLQRAEDDDVWPDGQNRGECGGAGQLGHDEGGGAERVELHGQQSALEGHRDAPCGLRCSV